MLFRGTGQPARLPSCLPAFAWTELCWFGWKSCRWISPNPRSNLVLPFFTLILRRLGLDRSKLHLWCSQRSWGWSYALRCKLDLLNFKCIWFARLKKRISARTRTKFNIKHLGSDLWSNWLRGKCGGNRTHFQSGHALCRRQRERQLSSEEKSIFQKTPLNWL